MGKPVGRDKRNTNGAGDASRISATFQESRSSLTRFVARFMRHSPDIEDIVQETFLRSYAAELKQQIEAPKAFLFTTAKNLALKHVTKCSYRLTDYLEDPGLPEVLTDEVSLEQCVEGQERFALFCKAVQHLPLQCRRAFILRKVYGLSHKEVAEYLDISISTVEKHLAAGIMRCSEYLRARGYPVQQNKVNSDRKKRDGEQ